MTGSGYSPVFKIRPIMHNQPYVGRIALCTRKKLLKSGEIRHFYGTSLLTSLNTALHYSAHTILFTSLHTTLNYITLCNKSSTLEFATDNIGDRLSVIICQYSLSVITDKILPIIISKIFIQKLALK